MNDDEFYGYVYPIYPPEFDIKDTAYNASVPYTDIHSIFDNTGQITHKLYDKRNDFNLYIVIFEQQHSYFYCLFILLMC